MIPKRVDNLPWREIDGRIVILAPQQGEVHELNPVASHIWRQIDGTRSVREIAQAVTECFDVPAEEAYADVTALLEKFTNSNLIRWIEAGS